MICDLVQVETQDGILLHGALYETSNKDWTVQ